ncbi:hypothetical protein [Chryseobacterium oryctis]|uniref:Glycine zipper family protein n=1 Tax=Chryseobacterium oryctis TaxID=2952618 RepID=A0ABT3HMU4_9FLAO|nr:hypothetical protein [Chryseobacterium oryctis]MCW3161109.1 hypothetical protein [Chryseobacterium oryctis]
MKTKTFLTVIGLVTSQTLFYSCNEDNRDSQSISNLPSLTESIINGADGVNGLNFKSGNYFTAPDTFNSAVNYIQSKILQQGISYVLTQDDLNIFYDKAGISLSERMSLDQVNSIISKTLSSLQLPFAEILNQLQISDNAKSLALQIDQASIINIEQNSIYKILSDNEKMLIKNLNDFKYNIEKDQYSINKNVASKTPPFIWGGMAGWGVGAGVGFLVGGPVGMVVGAGIGVLVGSVVGAVTGKK